MRIRDPSVDIAASGHDSSFDSEKVPIEWKAVHPCPSMAAQFRRPQLAAGELDTLHPCQLMIPVGRPGLGVLPCHLLADAGYVDVPEASTLEDAHGFGDRSRLHEFDSVPPAPHPVSGGPWYSIVGRLVPSL